MFTPAEGVLWVPRDAFQRLADLQRQIDVGEVERSLAKTRLAKARALYRESAKYRLPSRERAPPLAWTASRDNSCARSSAAASFWQRAIAPTSFSGGRCAMTLAQFC